ncbi:MAG: hypothetical protein KIT84_16455 [Labilithrix sp.]|nr:hypothetical protein [Labilithrix sp.]MCW5812622.1 hypothetical protein [Labilithrix sp.]
MKTETSSPCPLGVHGARVAYEETETGARLTFTAPSEKVAELQSRARDASAMHGTGRRLGQGHEGKHGEGGYHGLKPMQMPAAYAGEQDLEGGARIDITPHDPNDLAALRAKVQTRARELMESCE